MNKTYKPKFPKPNKFNAKKVKDFNGKVIADSKAEREYYTRNLFLREKIGEIKNVTKWPTIQLTPFIDWKLDYSYYEKETKPTIYVDVKGVETGEFRLKKNLWKTHGRGPLEIAKKTTGGKWVIKRYMTLVYI